MGLDWLRICADATSTDCVQPIQLSYLIALVIGAVLFAIIARRSRDLSTATLTLMVVAIAINIAVGSPDLRPAPPDLPRLDRHGPRRGAGRAVGRGADGPPLEPDLVDPARPRRRRADGRVLRTGRRRHRPDGRVLGVTRRLPAPQRRCPRRRVPGACVRHRGGRHRPPGRPSDDRADHRLRQHRLAEPLRRRRSRHRRGRHRRRLGLAPDDLRPARARTRGSGPTSSRRPRSPPAS